MSDVRVRQALRAMFDDTAVDDGLAATQIDGQRRGETLDIAEFAQLAMAIRPVARQVD
jgi:16S rRNA A1518/A1519 N6-dimethyltransferase RsmA/KsgA/DIM1 with predicted DNA glycosylase/AP lyase activity